MKTAKKTVLLLLPLSTVAFVPSLLHGTGTCSSTSRTTSRRFSASLNEDSSSSSSNGDENSESTVTSTTRPSHHPYYATPTIPTSNGNSKDDIEEQEEKTNVVMSQALPFLPVSDVLRDSPLAGNAGFDPLHLASSKEQLMWFREAEIKHARLAMLVRRWLRGKAATCILQREKCRTNEEGMPIQAR